MTPSPGTYSEAMASKFCPNSPHAKEMKYATPADRGKVDYYKNSRQQVEEREASPARDSRRSNSHRHITDDHNEGEQMDHHCKW